MIGAAGLTFAIALGANNRAGAATLAGARTGKALSPWVSIAGDGTITLMSPATEMGQGSMTSLPLILAEELDADWQKVRVVPAPPNAALYGNPNFGGVMMYTAAQQRSDRLFPPAAHLRRAGPPRAPRQCGQTLGRPHRRVDHRAECGGACEIGPPPHLRRDRRLCRDSRQAAGNQARGFEEAGAVPAHRQGRDARRAAEQGQRQRNLQHRRPGPGDALWRSTPRPGRRIGPAQDRRRQGKGGHGRHRYLSVAARRRGGRRDAVGGICGTRGTHPFGHMDPHRHGVGLR